MTGPILGAGYPSNRLYGVLRLPGVMEIGCLTITVRETAPGGADWLDVCIPSGMLALAFDVEYPLLRPSNPWLKVIDQFLLKCAQVAYEAVPFDLALIGEEVSGTTDSQLVSADQVERGGYILSRRLAQRLNLQQKGKPLRSQLLWFPAPED